MYIIDSSLKIERNLSIILANMLFINDIDLSKSLGNKSSALGFNTKADILLDSEFISDDDRKKFQLFMEIRNQFAHNIKCETYLDCLKLVDGCDKRLTRYYPIDDSGTSKEDQIHDQIDNLVADINNVINNCQSKLIEGLKEFINSEFYSQAWEELKKSLINSIVNLDKIIDLPIESENLKKFKDNLFKQIIDNSADSMEKRMQDLKNKVIRRKLKELE